MEGKQIHKKKDKKTIRIENKLTKEILLIEAFKFERERERGWEGEKLCLNP